MKHDVTELAPEQMPGYMIPMWLGFIGFAIRQDWLIKEYREDTSDKYRPAMSPIDKLIDEATDHDWQFIKSFVDWLNRNYWGEI